MKCMKIEKILPVQVQSVSWSHGSEGWTRGLLAVKKRDKMRV